MMSCVPTKFRSETPSLLDLVFRTNEQDMIDNITTLATPRKQHRYYVRSIQYVHNIYGNSDDACIEFDLICYSKVIKPENIKYNTRAANIELMKQALSDVDWGNLGYFRN